LKQLLEISIYSTENWNVETLTLSITCHLVTKLHSDHSLLTNVVQHEHFCSKAVRDLGCYPLKGRDFVSELSCNFFWESKHISCILKSIWLPFDMHKMFDVWG